MRTAASPCAVRLDLTTLLGARPAPRSVLGSLGAFGLGAAALAACTASAEDVRAPQDQLFFPTGLAISPDEKVLFIANANSELRFDSGAVSVMDLGQVQAVLAPWLACQRDHSPCPAFPDGCIADPEHVETMTCQESKFLRVDAGVRIGNFATDISVQDFSNGSSGPLRLFVPTRGDPSIAWADYNGTRLSCTASQNGYELCDDAHRLTAVLNDPDLAIIPTEPYGVFASTIKEGPGVPPTNGFAMVSHLANGAITLINAPADSSRVEIVDLVINVFAPSLSTGIRGASALSGRPSTTPGVSDTVYVGSSSEDRIQTFTVGQRDSAAEFLLPGAYFFLDSVGNGAGSSSDTRGVRFSPKGDRLYIANRLPPSLQVYDTSLSATGVPRNTATGSSDICREASTLAVLDAGGGERAYVTCFQDGQVYVVDPTGQSQVEDIITVGRGPYAAAGSASRKQLYVSNFLEDTIAVIDLDPSSPTRNRVVLRIGTARTP